MLPAKKLVAILFIMFALAQLLPVLEIVAELFGDNSEAGKTFLTGKLGGHLFMAGIVLFFALRLLRKDKTS